MYLDPNEGLLPHQCDTKGKLAQVLKRGDKISGNPCPVCRDPKIQVDYRNVKLLEQFISTHSGVIHDPTRTGVCMKQHKNLTRAIDAARDHGLLPFLVPFVEFKMVA
ncbi:UNVERIFIED_CONTAM: hypothetical protein FKN15_074566 [Acipenser sinensis]